MDANHRKSGFLSSVAHSSKFCREEKQLLFGFPGRSSPCFPDGVDVRGNSAEMHLAMFT